jgi:hypothetical protein
MEMICSSETSVDFIRMHSVISKWQNAVTTALRTLDPIYISYISHRNHKKYIVTYQGVSWLIRQVLDLVIEFIGFLYNLLQKFTNRYVTHCRFQLGPPLKLFSLWTELEWTTQLLLVSCYIASRRIAAQKTHPLLSSILTHTIYQSPLATLVLLLRACIVGVA